MAKWINFDCCFLCAFAASLNNVLYMFLSSYKGFVPNIYSICMVNAFLPLLPNRSIFQCETHHHPKQHELIGITQAHSVQQSIAFSWTEHSSAAQQKNKCAQHKHRHSIICDRGTSIAIWMAHKKWEITSSTRRQTLISPLFIHNLSKYYVHRQRT